MLFLPNSNDHYNKMIYLIVFLHRIHDLEALCSPRTTSSLELKKENKYTSGFFSELCSGWQRVSELLKIRFIQDQQQWFHFCFYW